jgi:hypothetical protein
MKISNLLLSAILVIGTVGVAVAQPAPPPGGGRGAGLRAACSADIQASCAGKAGPEIRQCLADNQTKLSADCKTALAAAPARGAAPPAGQ